MDSTQNIDDRLAVLYEYADYDLGDEIMPERPRARDEKLMAGAVLKYWDEHKALLELYNDMGFAPMAKVCRSIAFDRAKQLIDRRVELREMMKEAEANCKKTHEIYSPRELGSKVIAYRTSNRQWMIIEQVDRVCGITGLEDREVCGKRVVVFSTKEEFNDAVKKIIDTGEAVVEITTPEKRIPHLHDKKSMRIADYRAVVRQRQLQAEREAMERLARDKARKKAENQEVKVFKPRVERKVGDVHPKHPNWIWTEYKPGKFEWRTNPEFKKHRGRKKDEPKETVQKGEKIVLEVPQAPVQPARKRRKKEEPMVKKERKEPPHYIIEEWTDNVKGSRHERLSKEQQTAYNLIVKGYRVTSDYKFFIQPEGDEKRKSCNWESVLAMLRKFKTDYIPMGLVLEDRK